MFCLTPVTPFKTALTDQASLQTHSDLSNGNLGVDLDEVRLNCLDTNLNPMTSNEKGLEILKILMEIKDV